MSVFDITLSPSQIEFVLKPGINLTQAYNVINNSNESITLNTEVLPWIPAGSDGSVNYDQAIANPNIQFSLGNSDIVLGQPFVLPANSQQQIILKIKTNSTVSLSDNYYTFFVSQNLQTNTKDNFSQATGKVGSHILLSVSNTENPSVSSKIQSFTTSPKIKDVFFGPITFSGKIKNDSTFFFKANGKIVITKNGQTVKEITLNGDNVLANHNRDIGCSGTSCQMSAPFWPGQYNVSVQLDSNLNAPTYETTFFVWPISPIIFLLLATGVFFGIKKIKKLFSNKLKSN